MKSLCFFLIFCYKINSEASFYALSVCETVSEKTKPATVRVALICATDPRFYAWMMYLSYYVSRMCMYKECDLYLRGFKTKLNTLFDIAAIRKRKWGNEGGIRLHFCKIFLSTHREVLWTQWQSVEVHFKWIQWLLSCQAFKTLNIWKSQDGCNTLLVTT